MDGTVVMTVSCLPGRPVYLFATLNSWNRVSRLDQWSFRFHVEPGDLQSECLEIINNWKTDTQHSAVSVVCNDSRLGVLRNPWVALNTAFSSSMLPVILAEEDIVVSSDILEYMSESFEKYRSNSSVLAVCASNFSLGGNPSVTYLAPDFCPLLWGTWHDRWQQYLRDTWDFDYSTGNPDGSRAGWDWNIRQRIIPQHSLQCVHPEISRALHIGEHGVHMLPQDFPASQAPSFRRLTQ